MLKDFFLARDIEILFMPEVTFVDFPSIPGYQTYVNTGTKQG
jgi:hypothetical protein